MTRQALALDAHPPLAELRLLRAGDGNAVDSLLMEELRRACDALRDRGDVNAVILAAEGRDFSRGGAVPEGETAPFRCLELLPQPVIAAVQGEAMGAGLELALACDVRITAADAAFGMPQVAAGAVPSGGGTQRLPRLIGRARATALLLFGETLDAAAALACGLVNAVEPDAAAARLRATAFAERIAQRGPLAVRYAKEAMLRGLDLPLEAALRYETDLTIILQTTADRAEGVRAFLEKRPPEFKGE